MPKPVLIIVSGPPASGKTTVAEKIAAEMGWPLIYKDAIKERLYDHVRCENNEHALALEPVSYAMMYYIAECMVRAATPLILESNFKPRFETETLHSLQEKYGFRVLQIYCTGDEDVLLQRFEDRAKSEDRHPVHDDQQNLEDLRANLENGEYGMMDLGGVTLTVDLTDFEAIDYGELFTRIRESVGIASRTG